ncbi:hypothetical protein [Paraurantiacibacter namhicola]|uniref:Nucleotide modification associated domain-containing protein n=1 Tax=Paraurantiacibacter namhicola TaxID=645517 RepID=A0A1C7D6E5_9SPHN|nr:hypothetical protein [Paraurantiacibacter namhicola]ANU07030.1 hypothetical protein A6F65_00709 [Paraurantiacibacter namhicola]
MKIILSRKGFDSGSGGGPSPIVDGRPLSLPIPAGDGPSRTTYGALGLADHAAQASRGKLGGEDACHHDPMFLEDGTCLFGQCGAAQTHLENRGVGVGDTFVFFGLFRAPGEAPHHRIFGYLRVDAITRLADGSERDRARLAGHGHPHAIGMLAKNDVIYEGAGRTARSSPDGLRLSVPGASPSLWAVPSWLRASGLSYHDRPERWLRGGRLQSVARGQEFVADVGRRKAPREWLDAVVALIEA